MNRSDGNPEPAANGSLTASIESRPLKFHVGSWGAEEGAPQSKNHDLHDFMGQITAEMASEYARIQRRTKEDPGTAGDQGEENWAELLRGWLPQSYRVVTKGRIISQHGETSPQVDLLVLKSSYPEKLISKKLYLAAGIAAVFECKNTLRSSHIGTAIETCGKIKNFFPARIGTPFKELHAPLIYGILAHSHEWKRPNSDPCENIAKGLKESDEVLIDHPRNQLDLLCVADLGTWTLRRTTFFGPGQVPAWSEFQKVYGPTGSAFSSYVNQSCLCASEAKRFTPIGSLISHLSQKMAWDDPSIRDLADYYRITDISGSGSGLVRMWPSSIYSDQIRPLVEASRLSVGNFWDEWSTVFM